ncbi:CoxG family protein [Streptomyces sp. NPDC101776]|uniref:CoxG family protein n=1 Tax=Streptomyces sp. NPDC101776 TaxID=3366146 RepID=UPI00382AD88A
MKLSSQFDVPATPDKVVSLFFDPATMRECLPGCEELEQVDDKTFRGTLTNEIAHVKFKAGFTAEIASVENLAEQPGGSTVTAVLKGEDRRLGSTIKVDARMTIAPLGDASRVTYELEMAMWGKLGRLGEPVIRRRSVEVERQFSEALAAVCTGQPIPHRQGTKATTNTGGTVATHVMAGVPHEVSADGTTLSAVPVPTGPVDRKQDLPFLIAVAAAAFAFGVILGGRERRS